MDKLRALEYFVAAAEEGSFSAAARRLQVSAMAVSKLVGLLEAQLGTSLFQRHARGLSLTGGGATYLQMCKPGIAQLLQADEVLSTSARELRGTVVVGVQHIIARRYLVPALPKFMQRYPDITIELRDFTRASEEQTRGIDVFLRMGWVETEGLVMRRLATERFLVCAAPKYWSAHGTPQRPADLGDHNCLLFRNALDSTMDLWEFERGEEREAVIVRGQLITGNAHIFAADELGVAGMGVCLVGDLGSAEAVGSGCLVPVLNDWQSSFRPPVTCSIGPASAEFPGFADSSTSSKSCFALLKRLVRVQRCRACSRIGLSGATREHRRLCRAAGASARAQFAVRQRAERGRGCSDSSRTLPASADGCRVLGGQRSIARCPRAVVRMSLLVAGTVWSEDSHKAAA